MRMMERNKSSYWYLLYDRKEAVKDEEGNETGDMEKHAPQKIIHGVRLFDGLKLANVSNVVIK